MSKLSQYVTVDVPQRSDKSNSVVYMNTIETRTDLVSSVETYVKSIILQNPCSIHRAQVDLKILVIKNVARSRNIAANKRIQDVPKEQKEHVKVHRQLEDTRNRRIRKERVCKQLVSWIMVQC